MQKNKLCGICGKEFNSNGRFKFCEVCRNSKHEFICVTCGESVSISFDTYRKYLKDPKHIWQCRTCGINDTGGYSVKEQLVCKCCGNMFKPKTNDVYCQNCKDNGVQIVCAVCGGYLSVPAKTYMHEMAETPDKSWMHRGCSAEFRREMWDDNKREKMSELKTKQWEADEELRDKHRESRKNLQTDEYKQQMSEIATVRMSDAKNRTIVSQGVVNFYKTEAGEEMRKHLSSKTLEHYASKPLSKDEYKAAESLMSLCSEYSVYVKNLLDMGIVDAIKYIRQNGRDKDMWEQLVQALTAVRGKCTRKDLSILTGYNYMSLVNVCIEVGLDGLHIDNRGLQNEVYDFVRANYSGDILREKRHSFLLSKNGSKMELDIYIPEYKLAIEVNGNYWHSAAHKSRRYHYDKSRLCRNNGIRLIHIWEHEWNNDRQRPILESMILSAVGQSKRVHARKLELEVRESKSMRGFFDRNNIQGFVGATFAVCLVEPDTKDVMMAFNIVKGHHMSRGYKFEVKRGASKLGYTVVGGVSRLLNYAMTVGNVDELVYYIDYNYFDGRSLRNSSKWILKAERISFKNYWKSTGEVKEREPKKNAEINEKYNTGEVLKLWNAGTGTFVYKMVEHTVEDGSEELT